MKKISIFFSLFLVQGCLISPKELEELNADNNFYSPAQTIKCMQMPSPQRPTPINKKGEIRESYDQSDCYDDLLTTLLYKHIDHFGKLMCVVLNCLFYIILIGSISFRPRHMMCVGVKTSFLE